MSDNLKEEGLLLFTALGAQCIVTRKPGWLRVGHIMVAKFTTKGLKMAALAPADITTLRHAFIFSFVGSLLFRRQIEAWSSGVPTPRVTVAPGYCRMIR